jgi:hypothetical protein
VRHLCSRTRRAPQSSVRSGIAAHARIAQIEHRRCDISVAARAPAPQSSVRSGIVEGCLLAVSGSTEMPPLRGLGCFWRDGFYRDAAPTGLRVFLAGRVLQRCRPYGAGFVIGGTGSTEISPLTGLGVWGTRVADNRDGARIAQIEHRRCDISVAARATPPQSSVRSGIVAHARWRPR